MFFAGLGQSSEYCFPSSLHRSGVRALPPRSAVGSVPIAGRLLEGKPWWIITGLGARGLVYHAWLAAKVARAAVRDDEGEVSPPELLAWRQVAAGMADFDQAAA